MTETRARRFLTAEWRDIALLNWRVDGALLEPFVPRGVDLDDWNGAHYVSAVGFLFLRARVLGLAVPFHTTFEEVNLRLYVRREVGGVLHRGVVFVKELGPRKLAALVARRVYHEPYSAAPLSHEIERRKDGSPSRVAYAWRWGTAEGCIRMDVSPEREMPARGSSEEFLVEHYRGYVRQPRGGTLEYAVEHAPWAVRRAEKASLEGDVRTLWGDRVAAAIARPPDSAFLAEGSEITLRRGVRVVP